MNRHIFESYLLQGFNRIPLRKTFASKHFFTPIDIYSTLSEHSHFLLDSTKVSANGRYSVLVLQNEKKIEILDGKVYDNATLINEAPISYLRTKLKEYLSPRLEDLPPCATAAFGFFSYESARYFDKMPAPKNSPFEIPDAYFLFASSVLLFDHHRKSLSVITCGDNYRETKLRLKNFYHEIYSTLKTLQKNGVRRTKAQTPQQRAVASNFSESEYIAKIDEVKNRILKGDTYQANISQRLEVACSESAVDLYKRLSALFPVHYASLIEFNNTAIVSASPEQLVKVEKGRAITRPIAGTRRTGSVSENFKFKEELNKCEKERAEHAMLVDLERNDLGKVCAIGSVEINKLFALTEYPHVMHIESEISGIVKEDKDLLDVFSAMFPGGTITGVPKIKTIEIIHELEDSARGIYTGSLGYFSYNQAMEFNIMIRSFLLQNAKAYLQVGGGIVHGCVPSQEYKETLNKAKPLLMALLGTKQQS